MRLFSRNSHWVFAIVLFIYVVVQTRSSYMAPYVTLILWFAITVIYGLHSNRVFWRWLAIIAFYGIIGLLNNNSTDYIFQDIVAFCPFVLLIASNVRFRSNFLRDDLSGLRRIVPFAVLLYVLIFIYMGFSVFGSEVSRFDYDQDVHLILSAPLAPLFFVRYLLCYDSRNETWWQRFWLIIAILLFFHFAIITATKSAVFPILAVLALRVILSKGMKTRSKYVFMLLIMGLVLYFVSGNLFNDSLSRFYAKFDIGDDSNTSRLQESILYFRQCNVLQVLFGKGFGGIKTFHGESFIGGLSMLHLGIGHLFMKGGLLLVLLVYFPLVYIIFKDTFSRRYEYVLIAICLLMQDLGHEIWQNFPTVSVYWLLVYYRFYSRTEHEELLNMENRPQQ